MSHEFTQAICRRPGPDLAAGLTTADLGAPDHQNALAQFDRYVETLGSLGLAVTVLDPLPGYPDAHFVEDTAVVTPEVAVITLPGAAARQGEQSTIAEALAEHRPLAAVEPPGTLDGGDVLMIGSRILIGISDRTNAAGAQQLGAVLEVHGHDWQAVPVAAGLHFKSSVNLVGPDTLLVTSAFAGREELNGFRQIIVPDEEQYAANTLLINGNLIMPRGYPRTRALLDQLEVPVTELDTGEFRKMDGGLTCLSLRF